MKKEIKLVAVVINEESEILLKQINNEYKLPYGTMLGGERLEDAYKRFIVEDTGLTIELLHVVSAINFDDVETISLVYMCVPLKGITPTKTLPEEYKWLDENDAKKLVAAFPDRELLTQAGYLHWK